MSKPTDEQISEQITEACGDDGGHRSRWPCMTYEQGVMGALRWVIGESGEAPMSDE